MENKTPKFKRPNPQGARSYPKIVLAAGKVGRIISKTEQSDASVVYRIVRTNCAIEDIKAEHIKPAREGDEKKFNESYQRHLRKVDADKIRHPRK